MSHKIDFLMYVLLSTVNNQTRTSVLATCQYNLICIHLYIYIYIYIDFNFVYFVTNVILFYFVYIYI